VAIAEASTATRGFVHTDDGRLSYLEWGERGRPDMLLFHGGTGCAAEWDWVGAAFARSHHVIAPDFRGRGHSDWARDPRRYGKYETVADAARLVDALRLSAIVLIGASFGAGIAAIYAARHPERVRALVLDDGGPPVQRMIGTMLQKKLGTAPTEMPAIPHSFATLEEAAAYLRPLRGRSEAETLEYIRALRTPSWILRRAREQFVRGDDGRFVWRSDMSGLVEGLVKYYQGPDPADPVHWDAIRALSMPTLCLRALESETFTEERRDLMLAANPRIRLVEIPGSAHTVARWQPGEFLIQTTAFLREVGA
jgi:esterase